MSIVKGVRLAGCVKSIKLQARCAPVVIQKRTEYMYKREEGVPRSLIDNLTRDYDYSEQGLKRFRQAEKIKSLKLDHRYIPERHAILGPDLATAHFFVKRGAKVKFVGRDRWIERDKQLNVPLPKIKVSSLFLEALDASGVEMTYVAFDNLIDLEHLKFLSFSGCPYFNDWCLERLHLVQDTLEFLDISGCHLVTHNGLSALCRLKKLKGLRVSDLPLVEHLGLMVLLLEEQLPELTVFGLESEQLAPPPDAPLRQLPLRILRNINNYGDSEGVVQEVQEESRETPSQPLEIKHTWKS